MVTDRVTIQNEERACTTRHQKQHDQIWAENRRTFLHRRPRRPAHAETLQACFSFGVRSSRHAASKNEEADGMRGAAERAERWCKAAEDGGDPRGLRPELLTRRVFSGLLTGLFYSY